MLAAVLAGCAPTPAPLTGARAQTARAAEPAARAAGDSEASLERDLLGLINRERKRAQLTALAPHTAAAEVARAHSSDMRARGTVAHESPTTGAPGDRVRAAGIVVPLVLENVARAGSVAETHAGLMNSPSHRENILNAEVTHVGIGVAADARPGRSLYVTQVFLRLLGRVDVARERDRVRRLVASRRRAAGAPAAGVDPGVEQAAQSLARALAAAAGEVAADKRQALLDPVTSRYGAVRAVIGIVADAGGLAADAGLTGAAAAVGVGLAQGPHPELGENAVYVVVLLAAAE